MRFSRYCLNYKGLPFTTEWVEFPEIVPLYERLGVTPTLKKPDGSPLCTVPMIYDPTTNKYISDSVVIAEYLDTQYPQTPSVFPNNTTGLIQAFSEATRAYMPPVRDFLIWTIFVKLNPPSAVYFRNQREPSLGKRMEDLVLDNQIAAIMDDFKGVLGKLDALYSKNRGKGPYIMGDVLSWADILVASLLMCFRVSAGEDSQRWKEITSWHGRRWAILMESLKKYE